MKEVYVLTDGFEIFAEMEMDLDELDDENAKCDVYSDGNVWWTLKP